ncbi:MAG: cobalamin-dependent protein [Deltaproteobacteria bacterium]|nr:cobalamin-dependent protein [Deltaproteobacteria bacterium]
MHPEPKPYKPSHPVRFVTATSLFDGHDAAINIMRRILLGTGAEVIHLGHNRSVAEIVEAAIQEDADGIAVSSYQGGHVEFFKYMIDLLKESGAEHIKVYGGGGGVIIPEEIEELEAYGVAKIFSPDDGRQMGLQGMINQMVQAVDKDRRNGRPPAKPEDLRPDDKPALAKMISWAEQSKAEADPALGQVMEALAKRIKKNKAPVIGVTGTGGSGKSSLTDELIRKFFLDDPQTTIAVLSVDPSRRKTGGALLGDRIRMNAISSPRVYLRSMATRGSKTELAESLAEAVAICQAAGFDVIFIETAGIGQGDAEIVELVDVPIYVMTAEYGSTSQLEKIDMLDFARLAVINKFDQKGAEDALKDVAKTYQRNHKAFDQPLEEMPVFGTIASNFNDDGVLALYLAILDEIKDQTGREFKSSFKRPKLKHSSTKSVIIKPDRTRYLAEIAETVRSYKGWALDQAELVRKLWAMDKTLGAVLADKGVKPAVKNTISKEIKRIQKEMALAVDPDCQKLIEDWPKLKEAYSGREYVYTVRDRQVKVPLTTESLAGSQIPKVALPAFEDPGELLKFLLLENLPGHFPYTAGSYPFKRLAEDPTRMFAGEGDAFRTNRRFHYLSQDMPAKRLSTAFDSVTLYGQDPDERPDIYGKIGNSGVSICTLEDAKVLYSGFDLCAPNTSVSMTINGPAPIMLAFFFNTALDQQIDKFKRDHGREPDEEERQRIKAWTLSTVRGTVQADILKEDQGQNTCIFAIDFALKMMGDIQEYFVQKKVRNFYSVSISGYHIAEAGANPITQTALTLANGFTYLEYYLSRGLKVDAFAPNFSFFFSNGMDPEYTVIGRAARRIWAVALKKLYRANPRSQMLKYHIQTSGRSLHVQEVDFNDIRTTLQALCAIYDNAQSLHTNSYDEAVTTPTEASVRRALAIQLIINKEWGLAKNENPLQGAFIVNELTELVEEAILTEFERISERGGVLGAMERGYQRNKIQDESIHYEVKKHTGELPIIGVNTFVNPEAEPVLDLGGPGGCGLSRSTEEEKQSQLKRLRAFHKAHAKESGPALKKLKKVALAGGNIFEELMETARVCSLGQITEALYEVGGQYRRAM